MTDYFKKQKSFMKVFTVISIFLLLMTTYSFAEKESEFVTKIPSEVGPLFSHPGGVAVDGEGNMYVADTDNYRIQKFNADGTFVKAWGNSGSGDGQFNAPSGIAIDHNGFIYVTDRYNHRIQKFNADGTFVKAWGRRGSGDGQFNDPSGVAVDHNGFIYVADTFNHRIQKFNADGTFVKAWGNSGSGDGQFKYPIGLAVDNNGFIYVADMHNHRIQKFKDDGTFVKAWGRYGTGDGQFIYPKGVAVDHNGFIYVVDTFHGIQKFNADGTFMNAWGSSGGGDGQFNSPSGVAVDHNGFIYVADTMNNRIQKFNADGTFVKAWGNSGSGDGQFNSPSGVAVDHNGFIYVADMHNHCIQKFKDDGTFVKAWGSSGGDGQLYYPEGVTVDHNDFIYVANRMSHSIQKFNADGTFVKAWGCNGSGDGQFKYPSGVAVDHNGFIYVADTQNHRIQKFNADGTFVKAWGRRGDDDGKFNYPRGVTVDDNGFIYVADTDNDRIQKFNADGTFVKAWGNSGSGDGQFNDPSGVAVDDNGFIYVADKHNHRIQKFKDDGTFMNVWGSYGFVNGQFNNPSGIAVGHNGFIYATDTNNHRIQFMDIQPNVKETTPNNNQKNMDIDQNISITFTENIFISDKINMMSIKKDETVVGYTYKVDKNILTIDPNENLDYSSTYTITIPKEAIKDSANYPLEKDYTFSFTTGSAPDLSNPYVSDTEPIDNAKGISVNKDIKITFSENIYEKNISLLTLKGDTVVDCVYAIKDNRLTIHPKENLDYDTLYTVTICADAIEDKAHNPLEKDYTFSFTTGSAPDLSNPYVRDTEPIDNAKGISVNKDIKITFSENIYEKNISLLTLKGDTVVDCVYAIKDNRLTIDPKDDLNYGTLYTVTIPKGTVQDAVYNPSNSYTFNFTTVNNNADLSNIQLSNGKLNPSFTSNVMNYKVNVGYGVSSITLTPTLKDLNGKVEVNGNIVINNTPSSPICLEVGTNKITVVVTAADTLDRL